MSLTLKCLEEFLLDLKKQGHHYENVIKFVYGLYRNCKVLT